MTCGLFGASESFEVLEQQALDPKKKLAVWKFSSCDGCQLTLLSCEEFLLALARRLEIGWFAEASSAVLPPPYEISLVEGSISTPDEISLIHSVRAASKYLITIGACATSGGIQALRNFASLDAVVRPVYPSPEWLNVLHETKGIAEYVAVDYELQGCPITKDQLIEVMSAFLQGRSPQIPRESVCAQCKRKGYPCVAITNQVPCLGPITQAGCGAICPAFGRGCYGCFGPKEHAQVKSLASWWTAKGMAREDVVRALRLIHGWNETIREASQLYDT